ncbi:hypothetical protein PTI98_005677 [Pleurotus ostreatus]|nr:hypothetical protein PTI98_005677 [Pleurotus ostreatus]
MKAATPGTRLSLYFVIVATLLIVGIAAANDWSKPCFNGERMYDLLKHSNSGLGVLKIAGSPKSIALAPPFEAVKNLPGLLENAAHFEFNPKVEIAPVSFNGTATLVDYNPKGCSGSGGPGGVIAGELQADIAGTGGGNARAGDIIDGSIVPPNIKDVAAFAGLSFDVDAQVTIKGAVFGGYDSGRIPIISLSNPWGFLVSPSPGDIPIGSMVELQGQAKAALDMKIDSVVHLAYKVEDLELWYPASRKNATEKGIRTKESPLKLKASAKDEAKGYIEGHLIPVLKLGFDGFGTGVSVHLEADAFARVSLEVEAHATAKSCYRESTAPADPVHPEKGKREVYTPPYGRRACNELALRDTDVDVHGSAKGGLSGCVWVRAWMRNWNPISMRRPICRHPPLVHMFSGGASAG